MNESLQRIIRDAGADVLDWRQKLTASHVNYKSEADLVTEADRAIEQRLRRDLSELFPDFGFVGEESGTHGNPDKYFLVDPIDGTTSFVHGIPYYSVSVAVKQNGETTHGFVFAPALDQFFHAQKGGGAFCNGQHLHVSSTDTLIHALAATGFACVRQRIKPDNLPLFNDVIHRLRGIRRLGSAALDLCLVAQGVLDLYWEMNIQPWDVAAGTLIVREAGGKVTDFAGEDGTETNHQILASNSRLHESFLQRIRAVYPQA